MTNASNIISFAFTLDDIVHLNSRQRIVCGLMHGMNGKTYRCNEDDRRGLKKNVSLVHIVFIRIKEGSG